eukprot:3473843-Prymnesium_polylepis.1
MSQLCCSSRANLLCAGESIPVDIASILHFGSLAIGPPGSGKTETIKQYGEVLGSGVIVTNCSDQMDEFTCLAILEGAARSGVFIIMDEVNRLQLRVLLVFAQGIRAFYDVSKRAQTAHPTASPSDHPRSLSCGQALRSHCDSFTLPTGQQSPINPHALGVAQSMNSGFHRNALPDELCRQFRCVALT